MRFQTLIAFLCFAGAAVALGPNVLSMFKQIEIYDQFVALCKPMVHSHEYNTKMEKVSTIDWSIRDKL